MKTTGVLFSWDRAFFGTELRQVRAGAGLTAREAAWQAGVNPATWYSWEEGRKMPGPENRPKLEAWLKKRRA
jgi:DNA-binding XRE family transcriptional regulator